MWVRDERKLRGHYGLPAEGSWRRLLRLKGLREPLLVSLELAQPACRRLGQDVIVILLGSLGPPHGVPSCGVV